LVLNAVAAEVNDYTVVTLRHVSEIGAQYFIAAQPGE
jgi:hypothetical protein